MNSNVKKGAMFLSASVVCLLVMIAAVLWLGDLIDNSNHPMLFSLLVIAVLMIPASLFFWKGLDCFKEYDNQDRQETGH